MKNFLFFCFLFLFKQVMPIHSQLLYPIVGQYKKKSAQGMTIYNDSAYLFNDDGICRVYNLEKKKVVRRFMLSTKASNHVNNACFGIELGSYNRIPLLYTSECRNKYRCYVEELLPDTTRLVQTISQTKKGKTVPVLIWAVDRERGLIYSVTRTEKMLKSEGYALVTIKEFLLPQVAKGREIILTENDVKNQFQVRFPNVLQGAVIKEGVLYMVTGYQQTYSYRPESKRAIQVVDLNKKMLTKTIDLTYLTTNEPEDMDFYKGKALLYCGQEGGIYEVNLK